LMFASLRFGIAAAALSPFLLKVRPATIPAGIELGIYTAAGYLAQSEGLLTTDASRASFLSTFTVLVVPFLAGITGRGVRPLTWAAAVAALVGVSLLEQSGAEPCMGDVWSVVSAVAFGIQIFRTEHYSRILGSNQTVPLVSVVLATTAAIAVVLTAATSPDAAMMLVTDPAAAATAAAAADIPWKEVLYTGFLTTDVALLMELVALRDVASTEVAIVYTLEPVLGAGLAFAFLGERWGPSGWVGASLIVASCLAMQLWGGAAEDAEAAAVESDSSE
jgi:drug/metabolite transporter (DMT)-like permease